MTFAIITPALIVGAFVERIKFSAVLLFSGLWLVVVYCPVCYWVWGGGWLADRGVIDFAGGIVVHATAGASALTLAAMLGRRHGYPKTLKPQHNPGKVMTVSHALGAVRLQCRTADTSAGVAMLFHLSQQPPTVWMLVEWRHGSLGGWHCYWHNCRASTITPPLEVWAPSVPSSVHQQVLLLLCGFVKEKLGIDDSLDVALFMESEESWEPYW